MNFLVLSDAFWTDHTGGISKSLLSELENLVARGHRVVFITRRLRGDLSFHESRNGYELFRYLSPPKRTPFYHLYPLFSIMQVSKLVVQLHKDFHFDVAYVHDVFQSVGLTRSSLGIPYVYVFYAPAPQEIELDSSRGKYGLITPLVKIANYWIKLKEQQALSRATKILVRSEFSRKLMEQFYREVGKNKTVRIPLGVDIHRFSLVEDHHAVRKELGLPLDRPILLTVRRLAARMGLENLIAAMKEVASYIPDVLLLIGGKGYLEGLLHAQVKKLQLEQNVSFLGFIPEEKLPLYYQAADLFILPTIALEGFGLATIEALSCGTPVIATPVGANLEVIGPLGKDFICQDVIPEAIAERIVWWLKYGISSSLRKRCREYCESNFEIKKVAESIENLLFETARQGKDCKS